MATLNLKIVLNRSSAATLNRDLQVAAASDNGRRVLNRIVSRIVGQAAGCDPGSTQVTVLDNAVAASGTLTSTSAVATNTFTINGVTFTGIASGATGNQFNIGGSDTLTAVNIAAAINGSVSALVSGVVTATSASNVVTITAVHTGLTGNAITIASGQGTIVASGARLTGGLADPNLITYSF